MKTAMESRGLWARFALTSALLLVTCMLSAAPRIASAKLKVGDMPPQVNRSIKLSDYRGKIVIISFWASWCPPCRQEMSMLAGLQKAATRDKLVVFAVNWQQDVEVFWQIQRAPNGSGSTSVRCIWVSALEWASSLRCAGP
jgi:thiol-disulfide isomerase/thioredoxin